MARPHRSFVIVSVLACLLAAEAARAIPAGRFREHAEKVKGQAEGQAGARSAPEDGGGRVDPVLSQVDKARARYAKALEAADATALKAFDRQLAAATAKGDLDAARQTEDARAAFEATGRFEAHDLALLAPAREQWLKARERAARDVLAAFDRGIRSYTQARRLDDATALRRERDAFAASAGGAEAVLPGGAVLHLSFEPEAVTRRAEQSLAADRSGAGNDGLLRGVRIVDDGARGSGARFDGADASVDCGKRPALQNLETFTVAAFIRVDGPAATGPLLSKDDWKPARGFTLRLWDARPDFTIGADGWRSVTADQALTKGRWHHLAGTYDGEQLRLYVNGKPVAAKAVKGKLANSPYPLVLGRGTFAKDRRFAGSLDEVMIFNRALGEDEIGQLAQLAAGD